MISHGGHGGHGESTGLSKLRVLRVRRGFLTAVPVVAVVVIAGTAFAGSVAATAESDVAVRAAIVAAVQARVGPGARVRIDALQLDVVAHPARVQARIEPGAMVGRLARFTLVTPAAGRTAPANVGLAAATIAVSAPHARATRDLARGETLAASDVAHADDEVGQVPLQRYPQAADIVGARVLRPVRAGETIVASAVALPPLVRSGDAVEAHARDGRVNVVATLTAAQSGSLGDVILVVNPRGGRRLKARVSGAGRVEVMR